MWHQPNAIEDKLFLCVEIQRQFVREPRCTLCHVKGQYSTMGRNHCYLGARTRDVSRLTFFCINERRAHRHLLCHDLTPKRPTLIEWPAKFQIPYKCLQVCVACAHNPSLVLCLRWVRERSFHDESFSIYAVQTVVNKLTKLLLKSVNSKPSLGQCSFFRIS